MDRVVQTQLELYTVQVGYRVLKLCFIYLIQATWFSSVTLCVRRQSSLMWSGKVIASYKTAIYIGLLQNWKKEL